MDQFELLNTTKLLQNIMLLTFSCGRRSHKNFDVINLSSVSKHASMKGERGKSG